MHETQFPDELASPSTSSPLSSSSLILFSTVRAVMCESWKYCQLNVLSLVWWLLLASLVANGRGDDKLRVVYEWQQIDLKLDSLMQSLNANEGRTLQRSQVVPFGLEVYRSRLFVTLPRWRHGVSASLAYLDLNDMSTRSPALIPFPNVEAHNLLVEDPVIVSPYRIRVDRCGRLWVLDSRRSDVLEQTTTIYGNARLLVYDLTTDSLLRTYTIPADQVMAKSFFVNLAVEDGNDCDDVYVYAGDVGAPAIVVYSWREERSWRVEHNYFHPDPLAGNFSIDGIQFLWDYGLYGLALSRADTDGYATLYFHPLSSTREFRVNTRVLRNSTWARSMASYHDYQVLGSRGTNGQAGASFLDPLTGVLFYTLPNLNAVACWKTTNRDYDINSQGRVHMSTVEMVFPSDVKVDDQDRLWVLSNRLHAFISGRLSPDDVNFRILRAPVSDVIENTACDIREKNASELLDKLRGILNATTLTKSANGAARSITWHPMGVIATLSLFSVLQLHLH